MKFTVLGAGGFIGSHLVTYLQQQGHECFTPGRGDPHINSEDLGHVIYCIGLTADFRTRPFDTVRAHVSVLADVLEKSKFDSLLYLSSTRIYGNSKVANEQAMLQADPQNLSDLYNLSKMMGESLCFACGKPGIRVVRLSNVVGDDFESENFLNTVIRDAVEKKHVVINTSPDSQKDYVYIGDVVAMLVKIAISGKQPLYNLAGGTNVSNRELLDDIASITGCTVEFSGNAPEIVFPPISIEQTVNEFGFVPKQLKVSLNDIVLAFKRSLTVREST
jgi:nucleoside-diphosphate-sugar epimerase